MGKKGFTSLFNRLGDTPTHSQSNFFYSPWPWPSCKHPKTASFRAGEACGRTTNDIYKTVNSVYFDSAESACFSNSETEAEADAGEAGADVDSFSTTGSEESSEAVIRSLGRSSTDRLFFEPGQTNSLLTASKSDDLEKEQQKKTAAAFKESVALAVDSDDPYRDFRMSMEEMVAAHGIREWAGLEELLVWYLRINGKNNHGFIVGAFVDLLVGLATGECNVAIAANSNCSTSSCVTFDEIHEEVVEKVT